MNNLKVLTSGIIKNNPTFVLVLGMCPTLGTTTSAENGFGMGVATMAVLILSNLVISLIKNLIPDKVRIPGFYRGDRIVRDHYLYADAGVCPGVVCQSGRIHSADRGELHHPGTCGGIRLEERTGGFDLRRYRDWSGLHAVPDVGGGPSAKCWAAGPSSVIRSVLRTTCRWCSCWLRVLLSYWGI